MDETELRNSMMALHSASFSWALVCCQGDRELSEEVLQSVYVAVLDGRSQFEARSSFRTWLFGIIRNVARDRRRGRWWSRVVRLDFEALSQLAHDRPVAGTGDDELVLAIRAAIGNLPKRQREIAHLIFYEELSVAEAADIMSIGVGTARRHYARAKENLKEQLRNWNSSETVDERTISK